MIIRALIVLSFGWALFWFGVAAIAFERAPNAEYVAFSLAPFVICPILVRVVRWISRG